MEVHCVLRRILRPVVTASVLGSLTLSLLVATSHSNGALANEPGPEVANEFVPEAETEEFDPGDVPAGDAGNEDFGETGDELDSDRQLRIAIETAHAFGSEQSRDLKGYAPSLYRGKWYMPSKEERRQCIAKREAHHNYRAVSAGGLYRGTYQFSSALARGATWMMQPEVKKEMGDAGLDLIKELRNTPMNQWNRYWQDRAFWTIWAKGRGSHHWHGGSRSC